jgi:uncharacterized Zn finger protein
MTLGTRRPPQLVESFWARRWLSLLDQLPADQEGHLRRGREALQRSEVANVEVAPGHVSGTVYGQFGSPYVAHLRLHVLADATWERILAALARYPDVALRLLTGELPHELEDVFAAAEGVSLFPTDLFEIETGCACPVRGLICRHIAALHYRFASLLDKQPFLLTTLRGRTERQISSGIRAQWSASESGGAAHPEHDAAEAPTHSAPLRADRFYEAGAALDAFMPDFTPPQHDAALLHRLGRPPFANVGEDVITPLSEAYAPVTRRALAAVKQNEQSAKRRAASKRKD